MAVATAPRTEYTVSRRCETCSADLPTGAVKQRRLCDRCRDLARVRTYLNQARIVAERLSYDSALSARIRLAVKAAQR